MKKYDENFAFDVKGVIPSRISLDPPQLVFMFLLNLLLHVSRSNTCIFVHICSLYEERILVRDKLFAVA